MGNMEKLSTRGVYKSKNRGKIRYASRIQVEGKLFYLGDYDTPKEAALAYDMYILRNGLNRKTNYLKKK